MNKVYEITSIGHTHYGRVLPLAQTWVWDGPESMLDWYIESRVEAKGATVTNVAIRSHSTRCAECGCGYREHFEGKGVCGLGFCRSRCSEFVATSA